MFKFLVIIKLYAKVNIFQHINKKLGQDIIRVTRKLEDLINKHTKIQLYKDMQKKDLKSTFAKVNVTIKHATTKKLKVKIAREVTEMEIENKKDQKIHI